MSIAAAVAFVAGVAIQVDANKASQRASKRRSQISTASQQNADRAALREQAREARKQRARVLQASENLGSSGASREAGAISSLTQQQAQSFANVSAQQLAAAGISTENQKIADANTKAAYGQTLQQVGSSAFGQTGGFNSLFSNTGT